MTFAEELKKLSDTANFDILMAERCAAIKDQMREVAEQGIRCFQIDIVKVFPGKTYGKPPKVDNYYVIFSDRTHCNDDYKRKIIQFMEQQGFSKHSIEVATITNSCGCCTNITVRW